MKLTTFLIKFLFKTVRISNQIQNESSWWLNLNSIQIKQMDRDAVNSFPDKALK